MTARLLGVTSVVFVGFLCVTAIGVQAQIKQGDVVSIAYTLTDDSGTVLDTNQGKNPLSYTQGSGQIIRGLERKLEGMQVGEKIRVTVKPEEAYGPVNPQAFQEVPRDKLPPGELKAGQTLIARSPQGQQIPVRIHQIKEKSVVIDLNHPLAGKTLNFEVEILAVDASGKTK